MLLSKFNVVIKKLNPTSPLLKQCVRNKSNSKPPKVQQLKPKTPEDEYGDLFQKTMSKPCEDAKARAKNSNFGNVKEKPKSQLFSKSRNLSKDYRGKLPSKKAEEPCPSTKTSEYQKTEEVIKAEERREVPCKSEERREIPSKTEQKREVPCKAEQRRSPTREKQLEASANAQKTEETPCQTEERPNAPLEKLRRTEEKQCREQEQSSLEPKRASLLPTVATTSPKELQPVVTKPSPQKELKASSKDKEGRRMDALVLMVKEREVVFGQVPIPNVLKKDEVSVKVKYAAGNLTDLMVIEGLFPSCQEEVIPGRELSGTVCGIGDDVQHVKAGDSIVVAPCQPYALCKFCHEQKYEVCVKESSNMTFGIDRDGGWAQFAVVPANLVYKVDGIGLQQAVLLPLLAQVMCSVGKMNITPQMEILIQGCGLAGSLFALLLHHKGHERVSIWEDNPNRVDLISKMGIDYPIICHSDMDKIEVDLVISNGGGTEVMQQALAALSPHGQFVLFGQPGKNGSAPKLTMETNDISKRSVTVRGMSGTPINPANIPATLALKLLDYSILNVPIFPLKDFKEGLTQLSAGDINALVFQISKEK